MSLTHELRKIPLILLFISIFDYKQLNQNGPSFVLNRLDFCNIGTLLWGFSSIICVVPHHSCY